MCLVGPTMLNLAVEIIKQDYIPIFILTEGEDSNWKLRNFLSAFLMQNSDLYEVVTRVSYK